MADERSARAPARYFNAIRAARIVTAREKLLRVLGREVACHQRELERRVCEVGFSFYPLAPQEERPEPVHLNEARNALLREDYIDSRSVDIAGNPYTFYSRTDVDPGLVADRIARKVAATRAFEVVQHGELSGFAAERMYHAAMIEAATLRVEPYRQGADITRFNRRRSDRGIDLAAMHQATNVPLAVSVKNRREWLYPNSHEVWELLVTAAQFEAVPILLTRRAAEPLYIFMRDAGGYVVEAMNLWIDQRVRERPEGDDFIKGAWALGYKDVKLIDPTKPPQRFVTLFKERLALGLPAMHRNFLSAREEVLRIGIDEGLWDARTRQGRVTGYPRDDLVWEFWAWLGHTEEPPHPREF